MENIIELCGMKLEMYGFEHHLEKTIPCSIFDYSMHTFFPYNTDGVFLSRLDRMILILLELPFITSEMCN